MNMLCSGTVKVSFLSTVLAMVFSALLFINQKIAEAFSSLGEDGVLIIASLLAVIFILRVIGSVGRRLSYLPRDI